ncbi:MAG: ABC transporter permease [Lachnospiraceae bacterium]|nr:ABC transporter permease [Lachnospiraceae bacterium]
MGLFSIPKEVIKNRKLVGTLAFNDFKTQFSGSYLGTIWAFIQPVVTVCVYWFVFEKALHASGVGLKDGIAVPFVLWLIAGLVPWFYFSDALNGGTNSLIQYNYLVKKVVFNISILPVVKLISSFFVHLFFTAFALVIFALYGFLPDIYTAQILYYMICMFLLVAVLVYTTSAIIIFFRDLGPIINIALQVGIWATPIMWNFDALNINPTIKGLFKLNPMFYIVQGYRDSLINKVPFWEHGMLSLYFWGFVIVFFVIGMVVFRRLKVHFADVL